MQDDSDLTLRLGNIGAAPFQFKGFQDGADNQGNALIGNGLIDYRFGDGENYNFSTSGSRERDTHIGTLPGLDQSILQLNLAYQPTPNPSLIFIMGKSSDDYTFADTAGNAVAGITYFGTDGVADPNGTTYDAMSVARGNASVEYWILEAQRFTSEISVVF